MSFISTANASEVANTASNSVASMTGSSLMSLLPMLMILLVFYFLLIRPQMKKQREIQDMISNLKKNDKIVTTGGIFGTIVKIDDKIAEIEIAKDVVIKVAKSSINEHVVINDNVQNNHNKKNKTK